MKKLFVFLPALFLVFQNVAMYREKQLLPYINRVNDRIYCIGATHGSVEQMRHEVEAALVKFAQLIERGAVIENRTKDEITPLMAAACGGLVSFVNILLKAGARADAVCINGFTALDCAIVNSIPPLQENRPWVVTAEFCIPGRKQCVDTLMQHLHLEKSVVKARIAILVERDRKDDSAADKNEVCTKVTQFLLGE